MISHIGCGCYDGGQARSSSRFVLAGAAARSSLVFDVHNSTEATNTGIWFSNGVPVAEANSDYLYYKIHSLQ